MAIETGFTMLLAPLFTAGAVFGMLAIDPDEHHHIGKVSVSQSMAYRGFTADVANDALKAHIKDLYHKLDGDVASPVLPLLEEQTSELLAELLHVDKIVLAVRRLQGLVASEYELSFIQDRSGGHVLYVTEVEGDDKRLTRWSYPVEGDDFQAPIAAAARQLVFEIDPTLVALDHIEKGELDLADGALEHCRTRCAYSNMASNDLLTGIVALKRGNLERAALSFQAARMRYAELESATIGLAVVDFMRHEPTAAQTRLEAAEAAHVPFPFTSNEELRRIATMRTARGRLLAHTGQTRAAADLLESAAAIGADNYGLHVELSQVYQQLGFDGAANHHRRRAEQIRSETYGSVDVAQAMLLEMIR